MKQYFEVATVGAIEIVGEIDELYVDYKDFNSEFSTIKDKGVQKAIYDLIMVLEKECG